MIFLMFFGYPLLIILVAMYRCDKSLRAREKAHLEKMARRAFA